MNSTGKSDHLQRSQQPLAFRGHRRKNDFCDAAGCWRLRSCPRRHAEHTLQDEQSVSGPPNTERRKERAMKQTVELIFPGGKRIDARIGDHVIKTDQSVASGGEGSAPPPFHLFLASIAACTGIYAWEFCIARDLSTEGMACTMICDLDPEAGHQKKITVELTLPSGFPDKYRRAIVRAMDLCAVKKQIVDPPEFGIRAI
jgi:ribosomal protein S12 methylthiotransferase accessory factor